MELNRQKAKKAFADYAKNYSNEDGRAALKIKHTYKVCDLCERIAKALQMSDEDVDVAWLTGLLHDVGRFEQLRQYGTFNDQKSEDHADMAVRILFDEGRIRDYIDDDDEDFTLKTAVMMHNKYRVEKGIDKRTKVFCDILRDADKLDIFRVNTESSREEVYEVSTADFNCAEFSEAVYDSVFKEQVVLKQIKKNAIDGLACHMSFIYELVFPISVKIAKEQGYVSKMMSFVSENEKTNHQLAAMRNKMNEYFDRRIAENKILDI